MGFFSIFFRIILRSRKQEMIIVVLFSVQNNIYNSSLAETGFVHTPSSAKLHTKKWIV